MKRISCSDFVFGSACDHVVEAESDDELIEQARTHAAESHAGEEFDENRARAALADAAMH